MDVKELVKKVPITPARAFMLDDLCRRAPPGDVVECGVSYGRSAAVLLNACEGKRKLWLFDSYKGFPKLGEHDIVPTITSILPGYLAIPVRRVMGLFIRLGLTFNNVKFVEGFFDESIPKSVNDLGPIALLHFDADLYEAATTVFTHLLPKVVECGFVVIHDYPGFPAVKKAVEKFIDPKDLTILDSERVYYQVKKNAERS